MENRGSTIVCGGAVFVVLAAMTLASTGCSVALAHGALLLLQRFSDDLTTRAAAEGNSRRVGWGRGTFFYIPHGSDLRRRRRQLEKVMQQVRDALQQVGYQLAIAAPDQPAASPVLACKVDKFWFNNYTWIFPFVPTWGGIDITTNLISPSGATVWTHSFPWSWYQLQLLQRLHERRQCKHGPDPE